MTKVQPEYIDVIRNFFNCKINAGILGGRPGEAYYLIGLQDGYLIFLDPHNTQEAVKPDTDEIKLHHTTYHENAAKKIHFTKLDPSLGFAFLLRKPSDLIRFKEFMQLGKRIYKSNWIFHSMETKPAFMRTNRKKKKDKKKKPVLEHSFEDIEGFESMDNSQRNVAHLRSPKKILEVDIKLPGEQIIEESKSCASKSEQSEDSDGLIVLSSDSS